jgi:hypothetical protein
MLTKRYLPSTKNLPAILEQIIEGTAPPKYNAEHLKGVGFKSSNDRATIPLLKDLGFLSEDGTPTQRYHDYRDRSRSKTVLGEAIKEAYSELFHIREKPTSADREAIHGKFKSTHNVSDRVAEAQTATFLALIKYADFDAITVKKTIKPKVEVPPPKEVEKLHDKERATTSLSLRYNIEIHLPATKDVEVYNAIFKALREQLGE